MLFVALEIPPNPVVDGWVRKPVTSISGKGAVVQYAKARGIDAEALMILTSEQVTHPSLVPRARGAFVNDIRNFSNSQMEASLPVASSVLVPRIRPRWPGS